MNLVNSNDTESTNDNIPKIEDWMTEKKKTTRGWIIKILLASVLGIILIWSISYVSGPEPIEVEGNVLTIFGPFEGEDVEIVLPEYWSGWSDYEIILSPNHELKEGQRLRLVSHVSYSESIWRCEYVSIDDDVLEWTEAIELPTYRVNISWDGNVVEGRQQQTSLAQVGMETSDKVIRNNVELPLKKIVAGVIQLNGTFNELEMVKVASSLDGYSVTTNELRGEFQSLETLEIESVGDIRIEGKFPCLHNMRIYAHDTEEDQYICSIDIDGEFPLLEDVELIGGYTSFRGEFPALKRIQSWAAGFKTPSVAIEEEIAFDSLTEIAGYGRVELLLLYGTSYPKLEKIEGYAVDFRVELAKLYNGDKYWLEGSDAINIPENVKNYAREIMIEMPVLKEVTVYKNVTAEYDVDIEALLSLADDGVIALNCK